MNKIDTKIREAKVEDLTILKMFEQEIIRYERPFGPNLKDDPLEYYDLLDFIQREDAQVIVATIDEEIVGSGYALTKKSASYVRFEQHAYLGFMYVLPQFRGKGINGKIIDNLIDWAKTKGLTEIQLEVYAENESAVKAYKKSKFKPDLLRMRFNTEE
ncbi:MAG: GNAT family N-acetyltransferase [Saprospiraceae bacterium]